MNLDIEKQKSDYFILGSVLYIFLFLFATNMLFPPQSDDFDAYYQALNGIDSAIKSYLTWNSRFGDLIYVGFLAKYNASIYFDGFISIMETGFFLAFFVLVFGRLPKNSFDSLILFLSLFFILFFTAFGSDFLWGSGVLNNLLGVLLIMLCLIPYRMFWSSYFEGKLQTKNFSLIYTILFFLLNFFAGWCTELGGIITIAAQICFLFFALFVAKVKLPSWYYVGIAGFLIGYCVLYFSPGPRIRAINSPEFLSIAEFLKLSFVDKMKRFYLAINAYYSNIFVVSLLSILLYFLIKNLKSKSNKIILWIGFVLFSVVFLVLGRHLPHTFFFLFCFFVILWCCYFSYKNKSEDFKYLFIVFLLYCFWIVGGLALVQIPNIPNRTRLFSDMILFSIMIFSFIKIYDLLDARWRRFLASLVIFVSVSYSVFVEIQYLKHRIRWENMISYIEQEKIKGNKHIIIDGRVFESLYKNFGDYADPGFDPDKWPNGMYAHRFGVDTFQISDSKERILND
ncbi:DUF6056 family protein [Helicobacter cappadocius]|uniref:DUF6056 family protein n=1 Tax=Helicobacter cappadocius TaxID=3063998 RepID=A0AA90PW96_9HELI|nr:MULTISPECIES: DUF6056 family protein [unclassified Helicobacter]MDO7253542.1 DUF6056 family protein [Helicobacter sp. faydin-H75]MDP2539470.1 DUF6056 family protein [Helicobacter sp. faydin-H76]